MKADQVVRDFWISIDYNPHQPGARGTYTREEQDSAHARRAEELRRYHARTVVSPAPAVGVEH